MHIDMKVKSELVKTKPKPKSKSANKQELIKNLLVRVAAKKKQNGNNNRYISYYDPTVVAIPPSLYSHHGVFIVNGTARRDLITAINLSHMLICTAIPGYGTCGIYMTWSTGAATTATATYFTIPQLAASYTTSGPSSTRYTKVGCRIVNGSASLYQSGKVYVTNISQRLRLPAAPSSLTGSQWDSIVVGLRGMPERFTKPYSWADFGNKGKMENKSIYCHVVDAPKYNDFAVHLGQNTVMDEFFDNISIWPSSAEAPHPMSIAIVHWDTPSSATFLQDLTASVDAQIMSRWPIDSIPGQAQVDHPASKPDLVAKADADARKQSGTR